MSTTVQSSRATRAAPAGPAPVVRCVLTSRTHSAGNRRLARDLVWRWVGARWPHLMPSAALLERPHLDSELPGRRLSVRTSADGAVWQLAITHQDRPHAPAWTTRAVIADGGDADVLALETACSDPAAAKVIAPPAVLGSWVERLDTEDGGIVLSSEPRAVEDEAQAARFLADVLQPGRRLPFVVLCRKANSRHFGTDPQVLAESVRGLAHVACLSPAAARACSAALGRAASPVQGAVRLYLPGLTQTAAAADPVLAPLLPLPRGDAAPAERAGAPATEFRRLLRERLCRLSVAGPSAAVLT